MKTTITYACGHTADVQLYGSREERERRAAWYGTQYCYDCKAAESAAACKGYGLPDLTGSPKQIKWANTIRADKYTAIKDYVSRLAKPGDNAIADRIMAAVRSRSSAGWWINTRDDDIVDMIRSIIAEDHISLS